MEYLTVKEVAELKGCSERYIKQLCKENKLQSFQKNNSKGRPKYCIPVTALSEDLQVKYRKKLHKETGTAPELKEIPALKTSKKVIKKPLEEYIEKQREEIALWRGILREWHEMREKYKSKLDFDENFCGMCRVKYGEDFRISSDILYRKYAAYRNNDYDGLIDKRGQWRKGFNSIDDFVWRMFTRIYLVSSQPTLSRCYKDVKEWVKVYYPELYDDIPSEKTFRRRVKNEIPDCVIAFTRKGQKACFDKYLEYIERDYTDLNANDIWIADNHTLDVISMSPEGKPHRLSLTAFMDAKSGVIVGWNLCDHPCSQSTLLAIRAARMNGYGLPLGVYFDNGSEFLTHDIGGRGHRTKASWNKEDDPPKILELLGITMTNALVKNAKAKNIERYFYTFKEFISKAFSGYSGGTILERPEGHAKRVKKRRYSN